MHKRTVTRIAAAISACIASFGVGANSGYELGADAAQCLAFSSIDLTDKLISEDACKRAKSWSQYHPTYLARVAWVNASEEAK